MTEENQAEQTTEAAEFDRTQFIKDYVATAKSGDLETLQKMPEQIQHLSNEEIYSIVKELSETLAKEEDMEDLVQSLESTLSVMNMVHSLEDSSGEDEGSDAADTATEDASLTASEAEESAEEDGTDPAVEEEEGQDEATK